MSSEKLRKDLSQVTCNWCKSVFLKSDRKIKISTNHFCSIVCSKQHQSSLTLNVACAWCKKEFKIKPSRLKKSKSGLFFCENRCRTQAQSINGLEAFSPSHYGKKRNARPCAICKKLTNRVKYCPEHTNRHSYEEYIGGWLSGKFDGNNSDGTLRCHIRKYMFHKYDSKCTKCNWAEIHPISKKSPLQINHINGDFLDSKEMNLELLCPNCHSLTPTWGIHNKGNGRRIRLKNASSAGQVVSRHYDTVK